MFPTALVAIDWGTSAARDPSGVPDVMRGEETQLLGAVGAHDETVLAVLPGTHSKWARVEHGRIVDFTTFMTGALYALLIDHSMLGRLAAGDPQALSQDAYARRGARAVAHCLPGRYRHRNPTGLTTS